MFGVPLRLVDATLLDAVDASLDPCAWPGETDHKVWRGCTSGSASADPSAWPWLHGQGFRAIRVLGRALPGQVPLIALELQRFPRDPPVAADGLTGGAGAAAAELRTASRTARPVLRISSYRARYEARPRREGLRRLSQRGRVDH